MKRLLSLMLALMLLLCAVPALAGVDVTPLPQSIRDYLNGKSLIGAEVLDYAELSGHGSDNCYFVLVRTLDKVNILYCFKQKNGSWQHSFHTNKAVPQSENQVYLTLMESGREYPTGETFSHPRLYIQQATKEGGGDVEFCVGYGLDNGIWKMRLIYGGSYQRMVIKSNKIVYYKTLEGDAVSGTVAGTVQRDLRYASLKAIPKTLKEARAKLTTEPDLPASAELRLQDVNFTGGKKYEVYSAPDALSLRGGNGKAKVSTNGWIQVFGRENGFIMIQYSIDAGHYRIGYIDEASLPGSTYVDALDFDTLPAVATRKVTVTDDPLFSQSALTTLKEGDSVTWLATLGEWAYIEDMEGTFRGFVPETALSTSFGDE